MKKLIFITGNIGKLEEAKKILEGVEVVNKNIDLPEIQETNAQKVIEAKLLEAFRHHRGEYIIEDTSLYFDALNGLPGPLIKWFLEKLGDKKLFELAKKLGNDRAEARAIIGYIDANRSIRYFEGRLKGRIVAPTGKNGFGWDRIFMPDGHNKTFAQMNAEEKNKISMRKKAFTGFNKYLRSV
jgi:inosine triphosphate pyrophosphatase